MTTKSNSLSEQEQNEAILKDIAEKGTFAEYCIGVDKDYTLEWFHEIIADELEQGFEKMKKGENVRLLITMPPRHGKSDMGTQKFPSWVLGKDPTTPIIVASYSDELATDFGQATRDIMYSPEYTVMYPTRLRKDTKAKGKWQTDSGGGYTATGVGGSITGKGFKVGVVDDPLKNREEADSEVVREARYKWYRSTFYTRQEGNSMIILILTRWHEDDLAGRILRDAEEAKEKGQPYDEWRHIDFKAIATQDDDYRKEGEALWPAKFPINELQRIKSTLGPYEFSSLYQQTPIDEENRKFKQHWFKYRQLEDVKAMSTHNTLVIDPRGADDVRRGTDFVGLTVNMVDREKAWHFYSTRLKLSATELIDTMFTWWTRFNLHKIYIEDNQFSQGLKASWEREMHDRGMFITVELVKTGGKQKELRIESLVPRYEQGKIFHLKDGSENLCAELEDELLHFPKATNDDASDSAAYHNYTPQIQSGLKPHKPANMVRLKRRH